MRYHAAPRPEPYRITYAGLPLNRESRPARRPARSPRTLARKTTSSEIARGINRKHRSKIASMDRVADASSRRPGSPRRAELANRKAGNPGQITVDSYSEVSQNRGAQSSGICLLLSGAAAKKPVTASTTRRDWGIVGTSADKSPAVLRMAAEISRLGGLFAFFD